MALVAVGAVADEGPGHSRRPILSPRGLPSCPEYLCPRSSQEGVAGPPPMRGTLLPRSPFPMGLLAEGRPHPPCHSGPTVAPKASLCPQDGAQAPGTVCPPVGTHPHTPNPCSLGTCRFSSLCAFVLALPAPAGLDGPLTPRWSLTRVTDTLPSDLEGTEQAWAGMGTQLCSSHNPVALLCPLSAQDTSPSTGFWARENV